MFEHMTATCADYTVKLLRSKDIAKAARSSHHFKSMEIWLKKDKLKLIQQSLSVSDLLFEVELTQLYDFVIL